MPYNKLFINIACSVSTEKYRTSVRYFSVQTSRSVNMKSIIMFVHHIFQRPESNLNKLTVAGMAMANDAQKQGMAVVGDMQGQMNQQQDKFKKKVGPEF